MPSPPLQSRQWLFVDADDTLWENAVYFEEAIAEFTEFLDHSSLSPAEVRQALDAIELRSIRVHGYGSKNFARNLRHCFEQLVERPFSQTDLDRVVAMGESIMHRPIDLLEGVAETLEYLSRRHHLTLFTKGHSEEQLFKFQRSELGPWFHGVRVVKEKDAAAYRSLLAEGDVEPDAAWMIGNSPKSDIHPALEAGLRAVLVPHEATWALELTDLPEPSDRFRIVESFRALTELF
ncbi:MAG: HAD hydrolase-like protein [Acidobacteria bacterium]|nr:HAD hydrolase-like protein [Acidobacteriota bacterium]